MRRIVSGLLIVVGVIHLLPLSGVLGPERLTALYGLDFQEPNIAILMRHRAVLFGLLGVFILAAAFRPALQPPAFVAGFASMVSFVLIAWLVGEYNDAVQRVIVADLAAIVCLVAAVICHRLARRPGPATAGPNGH